MKWNRFRSERFVCALLGACSLFLSASLGRAALEDEVRAFEARDAASPPPFDSILFVGSSSIRVWTDLEKAFPPHTVLNRGFGGSQMSDLLSYFDRLVTPYRPALAVVYEGDNDVAAGEPPEQIAAEFTNFVDRVAQQLPRTDLAILSVKPSPSRSQYLAATRDLNDRLRALADARGLRYIDVFTPLLNATGQPRPELFQSDMLHMNASGYAIWRQVVGPRARRLGGGARWQTARFHPGTRRPEHRSLRASPFQRGGGRLSAVFGPVAEQRRADRRRHPVDVRDPPSHARHGPNRLLGVGQQPRSSVAQPAPRGSPYFGIPSRPNSCLLRRSPA